MGLYFFKRFCLVLVLITVVYPFSLCSHRGEAGFSFSRALSSVRAAGRSGLARFVNEMLDSRVSGGHGFLRDVGQDHLTVVQFLIRRGIDINQSDSRSGKTALHVACRRSSERMLRLLLLNGARVDVTDQNNDTPLHCCRSVNHARLLIDHGANITAQNNAGNTPIHEAAGMGDGALISFYLQRAPELIEVLGRRLRTPLARAVAFGNRESAQVLLQAGADVNACDNTGQTILHHAAREDNDDIVELLLGWGPDMYAKDNQGKTVLTTAAEEYQHVHLAHFAPIYPEEERIVHRRAVVKALLQYGVPIESSHEVALVLRLESPDFNPREIIREGRNKAHACFLILQIAASEVPAVVQDLILRFLATPDLN